MGVREIWPGGLSRSAGKGFENEGQMCIVHRFRNLPEVYIIPATAVFIVMPGGGPNPGSEWCYHLKQHGAYPCL